MKKRILFKAAGIIPPNAGNYIQGIGRSNVELLKEFKKINDPELEIVLYCNSDTRPSYNYEGWDEYETHRYFLPHHLGLLFNIEPLWRKFHIDYDLLHITSNFDRVSKHEKFVVTIHDIARYYESPWWQKIFRQSAEWSSGIITIAEYTKDKVVELFNVNPEKVVVIPHGISQELFYPRSKEEVDNCRETFKIPRKYFFVCSCAHPRKNAKDILRAFEFFAKEDNECALVLVWSNVPREILKNNEDLINQGRLIFLDYVSDEILATLYSGALASFLVSSLEGFGFPILESMACGTNCITCRNSSMTELGADKAYFVREHDVEEIACAMLHFAKTGKGDTDLLLKHAEKYTWNKTALQYLDFYKKI